MTLIYEIDGKEEVLRNVEHIEHDGTGHVKVKTSGNGGRTLMQLKQIKDIFE